MARVVLHRFFYALFDKKMEMDKHRIRIQLKAFDYRLLDMSAQEIVGAAKRTQAQVIGPIPLPVRHERYTLLISPHVNKDARDQYEIRTYKRILEIIAPTTKTLEALKELNLAAGVEVKLTFPEERKGKKALDKGTQSTTNQETNKPMDRKTAEEETTKRADKGTAPKGADK